LKKTVLQAADPEGWAYFFLVRTGLPLLLLIILGTGWSAAAPGADWSVRVNGVPVTRGDFERELERILRRSKQDNLRFGMQLTPVKNQVLDKLILRELLHQESRRKHIHVPSDEVAKEMARLKKLFVSPRAFEDQLKSMDWDEEAIRREVERGLALRKLVRKVYVPRVMVSDDEITAYYRQHPEKFRRPEVVRASHIFVRVAPEWEEDEVARAYEKIKTVHRNVLKREDFSALAAKYSECPSAGDGGDLGLFERGEMVEPFSQRAFSLDVGEVSPIVRTPYGYHIIRGTGKRPGGISVSLAEVKEKVRDFLVHKKAWKLAMEHAETLRKGARIEIRAGQVI
jgi:peptidyl-prolyl cis-trans isomerase C